MRRDQLEHAIRTACQVIGHPEVIAPGGSRSRRRVIAAPPDGGRRPRTTWCDRNLHRGRHRHGADMSQQRVALDQVTPYLAQRLVGA
ncbi:hypothetical protein AB6N23_08270 [Cellulomonas sp. 179-A 9B4 NHS]|uniref:hypothetical protein n=1 Tax=Cellulomonas sp. 179-A 9B4 NHS TaxID=3142379 RepID=UPI0039A0C34F